MEVCRINAHKIAGIIPVKIISFSFNDTEFR